MHIDAIGIPPLLSNTVGHRQTHDRGISQPNSRHLIMQLLLLAPRLLFNNSCLLPSLFLSFPLKFLLKPQNDKDSSGIGDFVGHYLVEFSEGLLVARNYLLTEVVDFWRELRDK